MKIIKEITEWRTIRASLHQQKVALVPTMGYLHEGHLSLVEQAKKQADIVVLSIFVNPLQFGVNEDFSTYPRDLERDAALVQAAGVDYLFVPDESEMYPQRIKTVVHVADVTEQLCGTSRPGHFDGVATVVSKLFNIIQPDVACFGQKDAQQVAVINQLIEDLNFNVSLAICPTIREEDGLAKSSRNVYLDPVARKQASVLYHALLSAWEAIQGGIRRVDEVQQIMAETVNTASLADIDYIEVLTYPSLQERDTLEGKMILALAVRFGQTRLIDNFIIDVKGEEATLCFAI